MDVVWLETTLAAKEKEIEFYKERYDNVLKGLSYWKSRSLNNEA